MRSIAAKFSMAFLLVGLLVTTFAMMNLFIQIRIAFDQYVQNQETVVQTIKSNISGSIFFDSVNRAFGISILGSFLLAVALGGLLAYTMTRSLRELTEATDEMAKGKLGRQVKIRSKDEVGKLALSFNKMSQEMAQATTLRRKMTADIAHDLRTPISIISGYAETLSDNTLEGTPEIYNIMYQETKYLSRLVEDLRVLSLADAGELALFPETVQLAAFLERVAERHRVSAQQRGISLRAEVEPDIPSIRVDPERFSQVFDNLIGNALRYTPDGGEIVMAAAFTKEEIRISVKDNGSGISPEDLPYVFDRFYRGDPTRPQNGESGLGLAIGKSIVEALGGIIQVESTPGHGTVMAIILARKTI